MTRGYYWRLAFGLLFLGAGLFLGVGSATGADDAPLPSPAAAQPTGGPIVHIVRAGEKLEMMVSTSRILTLQRKIPQAMVNNPDILTVTPLSPTQIQVSAKKPGVTQVNLWDERQQIYTIDVVVTGDARELTALLESEFPAAAIRVRPVSNGVLISGYVQRPDDADRIRLLAEEYYPKVINNISVAGVQQVLLHIKVYEVSRTKLRNLGVDWSQIGGGGFVASGVSQILNATTGGVANAANSTFAFRAVSGGSSFFGALDALRQLDLAKVLSEPTLVTQSGRPAYFRVGGEIPYSVSQGLGAVSVEWKNFGTRLDFIPFVLGNGRIRLDVRPEVSEVDNTRSSVDGVPAIKVRETDTAVELEAGQTLAIAGLVQTRIEAQNRGIPWVSDVPYLGVMFRRTKEEHNEIETLILVTPEIVDAMDPDEVPPCPPGMNSSSPTDWQLYMRGKLEVNRCGSPCPQTNGMHSGEVWEGESVSSDPGAGAGAPAPQPLPVPNGAGLNSPGLPGGGKRAAYYKAGVPTLARSPSPNYRHDPSVPQTRPGNSGVSPAGGGLPGYLGPIGYDGGE